MARTRRGPTALRSRSRDRRATKRTPATGALHHAGRHPGKPRTELGRWVREHNLTAPQFADALNALARAERIPRDRVPRPGTIADFIGGRYMPGLVALYLIRKATGGAVDLEHWVAESLSRS